MKFSTTSILLAAALGVSAHPSGHAHKRAHNSAVEARGEFVIANKPVDAPASSAAPVASPTPTPAAPAPSAKPTGSAGGQGSGPSVYTPFCSGSNSKRATAAEIAYKGNVGAGGAYGCNIMAVQSNLVDKYQYTMVFENAGGDSECFCWNKIGPDGGINGFFNGNEAMKFKLPAGGKQVVAVDSNSQVGCACGTNGPELTPIGQFASTWVEADFANLSNRGWSGADASSIVAAAAGMNIPGLQVCGTGAAAGTCSTIYPGGKGDNAFVGGTEYEDGLGLNLAPGKTSITVIVDFQG
ncbi:allergen asp f 4 [Trichoderma arundinaceum]|uniref:Allergen asp f 4 n=1 Tax=Trichoderma arundinaceum TaxID=490622 RepID=A0A395NL80_TRIAR|nr:allergen asp f 4 [Trichoderma arundinaceum]